MKKLEARAMESAIAKIKSSAEPRLPKPKTSISCEAAIGCFRGVLGARLVVPPTPGSGFWAQLQRGLSLGGFTPEQCERIAAVAAIKWAGKIKVESLVRQGAVLLSEEDGLTDEQTDKAGEDESWRFL